MKSKLYDVLTCFMGCKFLKNSLMAGSEYILDDSLSTSPSNVWTPILRLILGKRVYLFWTVWMISSTRSAGNGLHSIVSSARRSRSNTSSIVSMILHRFSLPIRVGVPPPK